MCVCARGVLLLLLLLFVCLFVCFCFWIFVCLFALFCFWFLFVCFFLGNITMPIVRRIGQAAFAEIHFTDYWFREKPTML